MRLRRPAADAASVRRPRYDYRNADPDLPPWNPPEPAGGWTLVLAEAAARAYAADVVADAAELDERRVAYAAFKTILNTPAISRAHSLEREAGVERFPRRAITFAPRPRRAHTIGARAPF